MKPIGLTLKNKKLNPYTGKTSGELMVIHLCLNCGKISCNRIAGDDNPYTITCLWEETDKLNADLITKLRCLNIKLLSQKDKQLVLTAIYGHNYEKYVK